jgi:hypothetical protein
MAILALHLDSFSSFLHSPDSHVSCPFVLLASHWGKFNLYIFFSVVLSSHDSYSGKRNIEKMKALVGSHLPKGIPVSSWAKALG